MSQPSAPDRPSIPWRLTLRALKRLPQGGLSRAFGWISDRTVPKPLRSLVLGGFTRATGIRMEEAEHPLTEYDSINRLFVRRLREGARSWPADPAVVASPVDGVFGQCGPIRTGLALQAKGREYPLAALLGDAAEADRFGGGSFATIYLSPRHYHRIHTPLPGLLRWARHVPGALFPVNRAAVSEVDRLFIRNERLVAAIDTQIGAVALVAVGAYNVGRISAAFDPAWSGRDGGWITNRADPPPAERHYPSGIRLEVGDEIMAFHLGSTVVLLSETPLDFEPGVAPDADVEVGNVIARPRAARG